MEYVYRAIKEQLCTPELGVYITFGIEAVAKTKQGPARCAWISDVGLEGERVGALAERCTRYALEPVHLLNVVEDALAEGIV